MMMPIPTTDELKAALDRLITRTNSESDVYILRQAIQAGYITLKSHSATAKGIDTPVVDIRGVVINGDVNDAVIITGDGNVVMSFKGVDITTVEQALTALFPRALYQLPPPPADFTGRVDELTELLTVMKQGTVSMLGLQGMGGIGKTTLGLKLTEQLKQYYSDAQFYLDIQGTGLQPLSAAAIMAHVIHAYYPTLKLPEIDDDLRGLYLSVLRGQHALLFLDNASDAEQLASLIPPAGCMLLVTSRQHFTLPGLYVKYLDILPINQAQELLVKIVGRVREHAGEIAMLCGCLPLALRLAGSALAERQDISPTDYISRLGNAQTRLDLVKASLDLTYALLDSEMQRLWCMLAVFPTDFDIAAVAAVWETEIIPTQDTLSELLRYSLVEWNSEIHRYRLHDLARLFANSYLGDKIRDAGQRHHAQHFEKLATVADELYLQGGEATLRGLELFDTEWENIRTGQVWSAKHFDNDLEAATLCSQYPNTVMYCLSIRRSPHERIRWLESAQIAARKINKPSLVGALLGNLGSAYAELGEYERGTEYYDEALIILRGISDQLGISRVLSNLGNVYVNLRNFRRAIELYEQSLTITSKIYTTLNGDIEYANTRRSESRTLIGIGSAYQEIGEFHRAITFYNQAISIAHELNDHHVNAAVLINLGNIYLDLDEPRRAIQYYEQSVIIARRFNDLRMEGNSIWNMAIALNTINDHTRAIAYAKDAFRIYEKIKSPKTTVIQQFLASSHEDDNALVP
jgi:tetratricopeptide (TPR) repeat protein